MVPGHSGHLCNRWLILVYQLFLIHYIWMVLYDLYITFYKGKSGSSFSTWMVVTCTWLWSLKSTVVFFLLNLIPSLSSNTPKSNYILHSYPTVPSAVHIVQKKWHKVRSNLTLKLTLWFVSNMSNWKYCLNV